MSLGGLNGASEFYREYFGFEPTPVQSEVFERLSTDPPPLTVLRLPTGEGKTEAIAAPFLAQFVRGTFPLAARLIYVLPTRALIDATADRLARYAGAVERKAVQKIRVRAQHGTHPAAPYFVEEIIVTTLDQLVFAYARTQPQARKHPDIPAGSLALSLVVFDEAHIYGTYTSAFVRAMLEVLVGSGVPVVLSTATLPDQLKRDFTRCTGGRFLEVTLEGEPRVIRDVPLEFTEDALWSEDTGLAQGVVEELRKAPKALITTNTVKHAQQVYRRLKDAGLDPVLVHSRFTRADRKRHEREAMRRLGRGGPGGVVISTQVLEAGLDLSADLLMTELAPADALVQRAGRVARFPVAGGAACGKVRVYLGGDPGRYVYERNALDYTTEQLQAGSINVGRWDEVQAFTGDLPYRVEDTAAAEGLYQLFEATLYASSRPQNIQVREAYPVELWLGESDEVGEVAHWQDRLIPVDLRALLQPSRLDKIRNGQNRLTYLHWNADESQMVVRQEAGPLPFRRYLVSPKTGLYDPEVGLEW